METTKQYSDDKGFTLIEVLIAMIIFSIGILAVAQMQIRSLHANRDAFDQTEATMWASNQAETLIGLPFTHTSLDDTAGNFTTPIPAPNNKYNLRWRIIDNAAFATNKTITIEVSWTKKGNINPTIVSFEYIKGRTI